jgi:protein-tyrosine phosphatase
MRATLFWIDGPWPGRLAIAPRPRGNDWLEDEVQAWRAAGLDVVVSALTQEENVELDIASEADFCASHDIEFYPMPIQDRGVPSSGRGFADLIRALEIQLGEGKNVGIHCRQGVGRSALLAACLLIAGGVPRDAVWERITAARGCPVPDTVEQREWVARFARDYLSCGSQGFRT